MALGPDRPVSGEALGEPPALLPRPTDPRPAPEPLRTAPELVELHQSWAGAEPAGGLGRTARAQAADRALIGSLIRATEAVAVRCDELAARLAELSEVVDEVAGALSADLARLLAEREDGPAGG
jgi:hypothetical protein